MSTSLETISQNLVIRTHYLFPSYITHLKYLGKQYVAKPNRDSRERWHKEERRQKKHLKRDETVMHRDFASPCLALQASQVEANRALVRRSLPKPSPSVH
jgi:aminoglycoside/choline kinase family phosphotransferase